MFAILALTATALAADLPGPQGAPRPEDLLPTETDTEVVPYVWNGTKVGNDRELEGVVALMVGQIRDAASGGVFCSGSLIHPQWVLTAAHCLTGAEEQLGRGWDLFVGVGPAFPFAERVPWEAYAIHPRYEPDAGAGAGYDIGLVKLARPITGVDVLPINRRTLDASHAGLPVTVVGYGVTTDDAHDSGTKRRAELYLVNFQRDLVRLFNGDVYYDRRTGLYEEAAWNSTSNACQGDSGGASLARTSDGSWVVVGVNAIVYNGCVRGGTGSTRTDLYAEWIGAYVPLDGDGGGFDDGDGGEEEDPYTLDPNDSGRLDDPDLGDPLTPGDALRSVNQAGCDTTGGTVHAGLLAVVAAALGRRRRR